MKIGSEVKLSLNIDGKKVEVSDECTEVVFIKLARLLTGKYEIHSCFTCRHGNFCPYGDWDNEIFCIKDFESKCKEDLLHVTVDEKERENRSRTLFDVCCDFKPCSSDYFTYK